MTAELPNHRNSVLINVDVRKTGILKSRDYLVVNNFKASRTENVQHDLAATVHYAKCLVGKLSPIHFNPCELTGLDLRNPLPRPLRVFYLAEFVGDDARRAEMIGRGVGGLCLFRGSNNRRIFGDQLAGGIDKNSGFAVRDLLDALALAVVVVPADRHTVAFYFGLFIVAVKDELAAERGYRVDIRNNISVFVIPEIRARKPV